MNTISGSGSGTGTELERAPSVETIEVLEPTLDGDHERMAHIVLEGFKPKEAEFVSVNNSVVEGMINGTPVRALCGKVWTPGRDPKRYPLCPTCAEIATANGWKLPAH